MLFPKSSVPRFPYLATTNRDKIPTQFIAFSPNMICCCYAKSRNPQNAAHPACPIPMRPLGIRLRPCSRRPNANRATRARPNTNPSTSTRAGATRANRPPITQPNANPAAISRATRPILSDRMRII